MNDAGASLPTVISTAAKRSGEISRLNGIARNGTDHTRPNVISTGATRSGEISHRNGTCTIVAGDFSTLSFNRITTHHFPYRHVPPLEMTQRRAAYSHPERKRMTPVLPSPLSFRPQRSKVEESHASMV